MHLVCSVFSLRCRSSRKPSTPADFSTFLSLQLKCAYLVPAKAPLPEEAIFNRNKAATERRHAAHKVQHKEHQIAKRNRNNDPIKRWKAGERCVSSNEDPSPELS
jgi:type IV secretory pathway VirB9-like protein